MKQWYVIQVYAGYEHVVQKELTRGISDKGLEEHFGEILIPSAKLKQLFSTTGAKDEQLFPGYMLIEVEMTPEAMRLVESNPRVIRFLGGVTPVPLGKHEVDRILSQMKGEVVYSAGKSDFVVGGEIEINEGPFSGFVGVIDNVDEPNERLTVMVSIFGRMTPVELGFGQVKQ